MVNSFIGLLHLTWRQCYTPNDVSYFLVNLVSNASKDLLNYAYVNLNRQLLGYDQLEVWLLDSSELAKLIVLWEELVLFTHEHLKGV